MNVQHMTPAQDCNINRLNNHSKNFHGAIFGHYDMDELIVKNGITRLCKIVKKCIQRSDKDTVWTDDMKLQR